VVTGPTFDRDQIMPQRSGLFSSWKRLDETEKPYFITLLRGENIV
jgi:hypothetical protein